MDKREATKIVLRAMRSTFNAPEHWIQGYLAARADWHEGTPEIVEPDISYDSYRANCWCLMGARFRAQQFGPKDPTLPVASMAGTRPQLLVQQAIEQLFPDRYQEEVTLEEFEETVSDLEDLPSSFGLATEAYFNDHSDTSYEDIIAVIDKAEELNEVAPL